MTKKHRVLSTGPLHPDALALLQRTCEVIISPSEAPADLRKLIVDVDAIIVRHKLPDDIFDAASNLRACVRHGIGLDFIPMGAATKAAIPVANLPSANRQAVVEHVVGTILALARNLYRVDQRFRADGWASRSQNTGFELAGKTLGVVGLGGIGMTVARMMQAAFGMNVLGHARHPVDTEVAVDQVALSELCKRADVISLHLPSTFQTRNLFSREMFALMKPNAILINTSRAEIVDETALVSALKTGALAAAAIDVFSPEPLPRESPLWDTPNILLTPHIAGLTEESSRRMSVEAAEETLRILNFQRPLNIANPEVWDLYTDKGATDGEYSVVELNS
jgi:D-3-phosphoglycerate dehydrogenase / 2-oxoglutarate reductase